MHRRRFLGLGAAGGIAAVSGGALGAATQSASAALVLTDISATTDAARLVAVLETFAGQGLAVTCACAAPSGGLDGYGAILAAIRDLGPGVEIALDLPGLAGLSPYVQGRTVHDARADLAAVLGDARPPAIATVLCDAAGGPLPPVGVRSGGVRNVLMRPGASGPTRTETWPNGVVRFYGGRWLTPASAAVPAGGSDTPRLYYVSTEVFAELSEAGLAVWAAALAESFFAAELAGQVVAMPVSELQWRDDFGFVRSVALRLVGNDPALAGFAQTLARRGIPVLSAPEAPAGYWVAEPAEGAVASDLHPLTRLDCGAGGAFAAAAAAPLPSGVAVRPAPGPEAVPGVDGCAVLTLSEVVVDRPLAAGEGVLPRDAAGAQADAIVSIHAGALGTPARERALLAALAGLEQDGVTRFVPLDVLANGLLAQGPIERRFRRTRAAALAPEPAPGPLTAQAAEAYMADARRAWGFIERFTDPTTGLCPATANVTTGGDALTWVTMWDVGSQINALVAAERLGLIDAATVAASARRILYQIAGRESQGRLLPNGVIRTDQLRRGSSDFDGCDAGRLLAALDGLRRHTADDTALGDEIAALVGSWDLDAVVIDGEIQSVRGGVLSSTYTSHCAHYAARAFGRWGIEVASPYRTFDGRSPADGRMALLEVAARIGPFGAEPLLLEALELGMSPESAWLAEVLHTAQVEDYAETGRLVAVSEMPIRRAPWFIYLGLQLGRSPREWAIDVVDGEAQYRTPEFLAQNMALGSKAAWLWAAYRPGPYADALVAAVRAEGELSVGFASNVQAGDGGKTPFTDLNTNAIILQAVARILTGAESGQ